MFATWKLNFMQFLVYIIACGDQTFLAKTFSVTAAKRLIAEVECSLGERER